MAQYLGKLIKDLRELNKLSQKELAKDICSQSEISKIEAGKNIPYTDLMIKIAIRLGVDLNYFFYRIEKPEYDFIDDKIIEIRKMVRVKDYSLVEKHLKKLNNHPLFQNSREKQFLLWHYGIVEYYLYDNKEQSFFYLNKSLEIRKTKEYTEQEIEILNSLGVIYCEINMCNEGIRILQEAFEAYNNLIYISNDKIYIRLLYNLAKAYYLEEEYNESIKYSKKGIEYCLDKESNYLLGELLYQLGVAFKEINLLKEALDSFNRVRALFEIQGKEDYLKKTDEHVEEIKCHFL